MELGLYTFGDVGTDRVTGRHTGPDERLRQLVNGDRPVRRGRGSDFFGLGEHHRPDYAVSATLPLRWRRPPSARSASSFRVR